MNLPTTQPGRPAHLAWTQQSVRTTVEADFAAADRQAVLRELARYKGHSVAGRARVQLAILQCAGGKAARVAELVEYALVKFRAFPTRGRQGAGPS